MNKADKIKRRLVAFNKGDLVLKVSLSNSWYGHKDSSGRKGKDKK